MSGDSLATMSRRIPLAAALTAAVVVAVAVAAALLSSAGGSGRHGSAAGSDSSVTSSSPSSSATSPRPSSRSLVPATSRFPAAGVCGRAAGAVLTVRIEPDTPDPRCTSVDEHQWLRVVNRTGDYGRRGHTVTVVWATSRVTLEPGASKTFPRHFGTYLARGVHDLRVGSGYRAEVWLH